MSNDVLVQAEGLSKKFCRGLRRSMWYGMKDIAGELSGDMASRNVLRKDEFWALKDISFELKRGECLGVIGPNGAGKTTLLRILNGLIKPDAGRVRILGTVGALIALDAGFNPILTGRENVYAYGAVLGFTSDEIRQKYDAIVEFSELDGYMDMPVQSYSSGMRMRLGFAVAVQMDPDVLILDEVLAVGDIAFQLKCLNEVFRKQDDCAIIFVSHSMQLVSRITNKIMTLKNAGCIYNGDDVAEGIAAYYQANYRDIQTLDFGTGHARVNEISLVCDGEINPAVINSGSDVTIRLNLNIDKKFSEPSVQLIFVSEDLVNFMSTSSLLDGYQIANNGEEMVVDVDIGTVGFNPGRYSIRVAIMGDALGEILLRIDNALEFVVRGEHKFWTPILHQSRWSVSSFHKT